MSGRRLWVAVLGLGMLGSQAGHLLAYELRFGAAAQQVQSSGAHAYFPLLVKTGLGLVAVALVGSLFFVGLARALNGRAVARTAPGPSYVSLLAFLFTIQLTFFIGQEMTESVLASSRVESATGMLLWGTLGQLPVAAVAAAALGWLASRFESALEDIRAALAVPPPSPTPAVVLLPLEASSSRALLLSTVAGASLAKRGPPTSYRISAF